MNATKLAVAAILSLTLLSGCSNQTAARVGNRIGIVFGKPIGVIASSADQAFRTTGEIVAESIRQQRENRAKQHQANVSTAATREPLTDSGQTAGNDYSTESESTRPLSEQRIVSGADFWQESD